MVCCKCNMSFHAGKNKNYKTVVNRIGSGSLMIVECTTLDFYCSRIESLEQQKPGRREGR